MPRRIFACLLVTVVVVVGIAIVVPASAVAATRRASMSPGLGMADALGIGPMSGAAVSGVVASVSGPIITLSSGGAKPIIIDAGSAKFMGVHDGPASIADVHAGVRLTAFVITNALEPGSALPAQLIMIERADDLDVTGIVDSIDLAGSTLTILGITISVDANTVFSTSMPTFAPVNGLADLAAGQVVAVAAQFASGKIVATSVDLVTPWMGTALTLRGTVKSISTTSWVITGTDGHDVTVGIDAQTRIVGDPNVGDPVQVMATVLPNPRSDSPNQIVAIAIVKLPGNGSTTAQMNGWVKSIAPTQWTIGGPPGSMMPDFLVKITNATVIYPSPKVGDRVSVTGTRDASGILVAATIALQP